MAPMPLTGTIGTTSSLKTDGTTAHRRSLPEPVVSFHLPVVRRAPSAHVERPTRKGKGVVRGEAVQEEVSSDAELGIESSLVLLQSLRQSRLVHLTALLPYLSTRHRTSTKYHPSPPGHPFPGGLDPSNTPHSLIHLGRADVRTGPLVFPKTRFGEVRVEGGLPSPAVVKGLGKSGEKGEDSSSSTSKGKAAVAGGAAQPPIDDGVVQAVSKAAQKDPKLQTLLHTAANGKATPEELRELAKFIAKVSEGLGKETAAAPATSTPARTVVPPPLLEHPSYQPIITVEYRENPSARFILPLWRGAAVERTSTGEERSIKVTLLLPAIGSTGAARAATAVEKTNSRFADDASKTTSPSTPPSHEQLTAPAPQGAEAHAVTWTIRGNSETPLSDGIWHIFGRVQGAQTVIDGKLVQTGSQQADEVIVQRLVERLRALATTSREMAYTPQLRVARGTVSRDLADHLTDKFAPRLQTLVNKPVVKLKRGEGDDDEVELVRDSSKRSWSSAAASWGAQRGTLDEKRKRIGVGGDQQDEGDESMLTMGGGEGGTLPKLKRKRHVAKFNPDGSLKLCQACGTNSTPMWRRGPAGKSTLCNACGAKWKVGRLVVSSEVATAPAPPQAEEETPAEVAQSADEQVPHPPLT